MNIGERTNVTGSPQFAKLVLSGQFDEAVAIAKQQVETGAQLDHRAYPSIRGNFAIFREDNSRQQLKDRGFSRAVWPDNPYAFPSLYFKADISQCPYVFTVIDVPPAFIPPDSPYDFP